MNALKIYRDAEWALEHNKITLGEFDERIKPLADVEAVVRCKDCIYAKTAPDDNGFFYCRVPFASTAPHEAYFYCASGIREDDVKEIEAFLREKEPFMFEWHDGGDDIY